MRERIYRIIDCPDVSGSDNWYGVVSIVVTIVSLVPLVLKQHVPALDRLERGATLFFTVDYLLRWLTADYRRAARKPGARVGDVRAFLSYPFTAMAIIDLVSLLPTYLVTFNRSLRLLRTARLIRLMKVSRVFKAMRYSSSLDMIVSVLRRQRDSLMAVSWIALCYVVVCALLIFNLEPDTFDTFFDALYWATISLTTVGYGDIFATSVVGRAFTMISSVFGIAIIALPASIITAGLLEELEDRREREREEREAKARDARDDAYDSDPHDAHGPDSDGRRP